MCERLSDSVETGNERELKLKRKYRSSSSDMDSTEQTSKMALLDTIGMHEITRLLAELKQGQDDIKTTFNKIIDKLKKYMEKKISTQRTDVNDLFLEINEKIKTCYSTTYQRRGGRTWSIHCPT